MMMASTNELFQFLKDGVTSGKIPLLLTYSGEAVKKEYIQIPRVDEVDEHGIVSTFDTCVKEFDGEDALELLAREVDCGPWYNLCIPHKVLGEDVSLTISLFPELYEYNVVGAIAFGHPLPHLSIVVIDEDGYDISIATRLNVPQHSLKKFGQLIADGCAAAIEFGEDKMDMMKSGIYYLDSDLIAFFKENYSQWTPKDAKMLKLIKESTNDNTARKRAYMCMLELPIDTLESDIPIRAYNALKGEDKKTIEDVVKAFRDGSIETFKKLTRKHVCDIHNALIKLGINREDLLLPRERKDNNG